MVSKKTCLVVDDSALARTQMQIILSEHRRLDTEFAEDAEAAIMLTKSKTFDIIFLDVMMPGMDGYQACKLIKTEPLAKNTVVVMLTSKNSPFDRLHGASVGCNKYLTKPVTADQIQEVLQNYGII
ncbi:hypothetical protein TI04_01500 [Achromatium sp. WMS2]|nr:hypothetical protein TI04_01500 [Achromatium sp. WMS2]